MKARWLFWICLGVGLIGLGGGLLIPAHLRAVDDSVVFSAGKTGDALLERGKALAAADQIGTAQLFALAAHQAGMPGWDRLDETVADRISQTPGTLFWGNDSQLATRFPSPPGTNPFSAYIVRQENREAALAWLAQSDYPGVPELLRCRTLTRTVLFPPSGSAAGQAFDAVVAETGLLLKGRHLTTALGEQIQQLAAQADQGAGPQPLEEVLMDLGALGEYFNWDQLISFVARIPDTATLHQLAAQAAIANDRRPLLFAAVQLSDSPAAVAGYLTRFPQTGLQDLSAGLWYGADGVKALAQSGRRFYSSSVLRWVAIHTPLGAVYYSAAARSLEHPWQVLAAKWLSYLAAGFCLAAAFHFARPPVSRLEQPLQVRGFHLLRECLFSLVFLLVVLLLSEPFLAQDSQKGVFSLRLALPMAGGAIPVESASVKHTIMNPTILLTLLVFFVLQALLYISCLLKLAEIRRQQVPPRMKLKLLENEDHLFDAGLYLGFVGTIVSLILASVGMVKFSLMAAYSSTSFGIVFVVIFKIFHLRPARRQLILEAELAEASALSAPQASAPVNPPQPVPAA